ncbi:MAG TPA: extracellular solute-binding protein [Chloroflexota bacterium]|nr:extracellular solute-binding protein [Chloroflexota bacterium]
MKRLSFPGRGIVSVPLALLLVAASTPGPSQARRAQAGTSISVVYSATYLFDSNALAATWWNRIKKEFQAQHPGVTLNLIGEQGSDTDEVNKIYLMLRSASTTPDVLSIPTDPIGAMGASGYLQPLNSYVAKWSKWKQISPAIQNESAVNGQVLAINSGNNDFGLLYDVRIFKKAGLPVPWHPHSWADILAAARKIKALNLPKTYPIWLMAGQANGAVTVLQGTANLLVGATQPTIFDAKTNKWVVRSSGLTDTFQFYHTLASEGLGAPTGDLFTPQVFAPLYQKWVRAEQFPIIFAGNWSPGNCLPFLGGINWPQGKQIYQATAIPTENGQKPGVATAIGGWAFSMTAASKHKDLAWALIQLMSDTQNIVDMGNWSGVVPPATVDGFSKAYVNFLPPYNAEFNSYLQYGTTLPSGAAYPKYVQAMNDTTGQLMQNPSMTAKQAADYFANEVTQLIGDSSQVETLS